MPRSTTLTPEVISRIAAGVQRGARPELVAQAIGVGRSTYYHWLNRGRHPGPGDHLYVELVEQIEQARALAQLFLIDRIAKSPDWRASAKLLEILNRDWARAAGIEGPSDEARSGGWNVVVVRHDESPERRPEMPGPRMVIDISAKRPSAPTTPPDDNEQGEHPEDSHA